MIKVYIPSDYQFEYKKCKKLYKKYKKLIGDNQDFRDIVKNNFIYSFYDEQSNLIGCIYFYYISDKLYLNGFANRHMHLKTLECLKMSLDWFNCDIYAKSIQKTAVLCLLRCGFKKVSDNLYKYER